MISDPVVPTMVLVMGVGFACAGAFLLTPRGAAWMLRGYERRRQRMAEVGRSRREIVRVAGLPLSRVTSAWCG